jgi:phosphohistidine phosphatase SixA
MMKHVVRLASLLALFALGRRQPAQTLPEWIAPLRDGGHVIVFRHGATYPDQADTDPFNLANVDKQRQLNDAGRAKAKEIGEAFRKLKIPVGQVHTSLLYRAIETGKLMFPDITPMTAIDLVETSLSPSPNENARRNAVLRKLASTVPPAGTNTVVVSHCPNILDAFGKDWFDIREGEASVFKLDGNGGYRFIVRVQDEWAKFAQSASRVGAWPSWQRHVTGQVLGRLVPLQTPSR